MVARYLILFSVVLPLVVWLWPSSNAPVTGTLSAQAQGASRSISFRAPDGATLNGVLWGSGSVGVVLSHMVGNDRRVWDPFARALAEQGYLALAFDFRGFGASPGPRNIPDLDVDIEGAVQYLRSQGAQTVFLVGASMGGTATLKVAERVQVDGVVALSAPASFMGLEPGNLASMTVPKLFLATENDFGGELAVAATAMFRRSPEPKQLQIYPGDSHGTDMLTTDIGSQVRDRILLFLRTYSALAAQTPTPTPVLIGQRYTLTVSVAGQPMDLRRTVEVAGGQAYVNPAPGADGKYAKGTTVTLVASRSFAYATEISGATCPLESGATLQSNPAYYPTICPFEMTQDTTITIRFVESPLVLVVNGEQVKHRQISVKVSGGAIRILKGPQVNGRYGPDDIPELQAVAAPGYVFKGWDGDGPDGTLAGSVGTVSSSLESHVTLMQLNRTTRVAANFKRKGYVLRLNGAVVNQYTADINVPGGMIKVEPSPGQYGYEPGAQIKLTAAPYDVSYVAVSRFNGWHGACADAALECTLTMNDDKSVTGNFEVLRATVINAMPSLSCFGEKLDGSEDMFDLTNSSYSYPAPNSGFLIDLVQMKVGQSVLSRADGSTEGCTGAVSLEIKRVSKKTWTFTLTTDLAVHPLPSPSPAPPRAYVASAYFSFYTGQTSALAEVECRLHGPNAYVGWYDYQYEPSSPYSYSPYEGSLWCGSGVYSDYGGSSTSGVIQPAYIYGGAGTTVWVNYPPVQERPSASETQVIEFSMESKEMDLGQTAPAVSEEEAAGPFTSGVLPGTPEFNRLVEISVGGDSAPGVVVMPAGAVVNVFDIGADFDAGNPLLMTRSLYEKLLVLSRWVYADGLSRLQVVRAWEEDDQHGQSRLHQEGRAADIVTSDHDPAKLRRLALLAVYAGFDWVWFDGSGVHVSVKP